MRRIKARVIRNIGTESKWLEKNPVLGDGEMALVRFGGRVRQKIGNGSLRFSDLSYQDNDLKIPAIDTSFPFLSGEGPAPEGIYFAKESGTYQPGSVEVDTTGKMVMLVWDGVGELEKVETEMPEQVADGEVEEGSSKAVSGDKVYKYTLNKNTDRILIEDKGYIPFDRPDIEKDKYERHVLHMDSLGFTFVYPSPEDIITRESGQTLPDGVTYLDMDRPDLTIPYTIVMDSANWYIPLPKNKDIGRTIAFKDFGEMDGYEVETVKDLNEYYQIWEDARVGNENYITRVQLRSSGKGNLPIWRYDFKPKNPQIKIFMIGLAHGWEKNTSFGWSRFMRQLASEWQSNEALTYIRQNVHIIAIPCVSPDNFVNNLFSGSPTVRMRNNYETDFIQATFTASGTDINITFSSADFPTGEFFDYENYFQEKKSGIEGKIGVTLIDSSNLEAVKHNEVYRLKAVNGVGNITLTNDKSVSGTQTGTVKFAVLVDPERNFDVTGWDDFLSGSPYGSPRTYYDNKGTKPFSLNETNNIKDIFESNRNIACFINWHSGAGDYFTYFNNSSYNMEDTTLPNLKIMFESLFDVDVLNTTNSNPTARTYFAEQEKILSSTPEWHSSEPAGTGKMTKEQATELHRWIGNYIYMSSFINSYNK